MIKETNLVFENCIETKSDAGDPSIVSLVHLNIISTRRSKYHQGNVLVNWIYILHDYLPVKHRF